MRQKKLYRQISAWVTLDDGRVAVYRCFEVLPDRRFCVQSKDFFDFPLEQEAWRRSEEQFLELLASNNPGREAYDTLEEAILRFDESVAWFDTLEEEKGSE